MHLKEGYLKLYRLKSTSVKKFIIKALEYKPFQTICMDCYAFLIDEFLFMLFAFDVIVYLVIMVIAVV